MLNREVDNMLMPEIIDLLFKKNLLDQELKNLSIILERDTLLRYLPDYQLLPESFKIQLHNYKDRQRNSQGKQSPSDKKHDQINIHDKIFQGSRDKTIHRLQTLYKLPNHEQCIAQDVQMLHHLKNYSKDQQTLRYLEWLKARVTNYEIGNNSEKLWLTLRFFTQHKSTDPNEAISSIEFARDAYLDAVRNGNPGFYGENIPYSCMSGLVERLIDRASIVLSSLDSHEASKISNPYEKFAQLYMTHFTGQGEGKIHLLSALWYSLGLPDINWQKIDSKKYKTLYQNRALDKLDTAKMDQALIEITEAQSINLPTVDALYKMSRLNGVDFGEILHQASEPMDDYRWIWLWWDKNKLRFKQLDKPNFYNRLRSLCLKSYGIENLSLLETLNQCIANIKDPNVQERNTFGELENELKLYPITGTWLSALPNDHQDMQPDELKSNFIGFLRKQNFHSDESENLDINSSILQLEIILKMEKHRKADAQRVIRQFSELSDRPIGENHTLSDNFSTEEQTVSMYELIDHDMDELTEQAWTKFNNTTTNQLLNSLNNQLGLTHIDGTMIILLSVIGELKNIKDLYEEMISYLEGQIRPRLLSKNQLKSAISEYKKVHLSLSQDVFNKFCKKNDAIDELCLINCSISETDGTPYSDTIGRFTYPTDDRKTISEITVYYAIDEYITKRERRGDIDKDTLDDLCKKLVKKGYLKSLERAIELRGSARAFQGIFNDPQLFGVLVSQKCNSTISFLLDHGLSDYIITTDYYNRPPYLEIAMEYNNTDILEMLLNNKCEPTIQDFRYAIDKNKQLFFQKMYKDLDKNSTTYSEITSYIKDCETNGDTADSRFFINAINSNNAANVAALLDHGISMFGVDLRKVLLETSDVTIMSMINHIPEWNHNQISILYKHVIDNVRKQPSKPDMLEHLMRRGLVPDRVSYLDCLISSLKNKDVELYDSLLKLKGIYLDGNDYGKLLIPVMEAKDILVDYTEITKELLVKGATVSGSTILHAIKNCVECFDMLIEKQSDELLAGIKSSDILVKEAIQTENSEIFENLTKLGAPVGIHNLLLSISEHPRLFQRVFNKVKDDIPSGRRDESTVSDISSTELINAAIDSKDDSMLTMLLTKIDRIGIQCFEHCIKSSNPHSNVFEKLLKHGVAGQAGDAVHSSESRKEHDYVHLVDRITDGTEAFTLAVQNGCDEIVSLLLNHLSHTKQHYDIASRSLTNACHYHSHAVNKEPYFNIIRQLLDWNVDACIINKDQNNEIIGPPIKIAVQNGDLELSTILVEHSAHTKLNDAQSDELLCSAVASGNVEIVKLLLKNHTAIQYIVNGKSMNSALSVAVKNSNEDITRILLDYNADPDVEFCGESDIRTYLTNNINQDNLDSDQSKSALSMLNLINNQDTKDDRIYKKKLIQEGDHQKVSELLESGVNFGNLSIENMTSPMWAELHDQPILAKLLWQNCVDMDQQKNAIDGRSCNDLYLAIQHNMKSAVEEILKQKETVSCTNADLKCALENANSDILNLIVHSWKKYNQSKGIPVNYGDMEIPFSCVKSNPDKRIIETAFELKLLSLSKMTDKTTADIEDRVPLDILRDLVSKDGFNINNNHNDKEIFMWAALLQDTSIMDYLLSLKDNVDDYLIDLDQMDDSMTALMYAAEENNIEMIKQLLQEKDRLTIRLQNDLKETALSKAIAYKHPYAAYLILMEYPWYTRIPLRIMFYVRSFFVTQEISSNEDTTPKLSEHHPEKDTRAELQTTDNKPTHNRDPDNSDDCTHVSSLDNSAHADQSKSKRKS